MNRKKIILCEGDSWTAGDIFDPNLTEKGIHHGNVNHIENRPYRLPRVWPGKLEKIIKGVKVLNTSVSGSSNDGIVRRVIGNVLYLLHERKYKPEEIFVIVGWSSPERKDFFYRGEYDATETIYPHEIDKEYGSYELNEFHKLYVTYFWNEEEYLLRFIRQVLFLDGFLKSRGIKYKLFNAFYEVKDSFIIDKEKNFNFLDNLKDKVGEMNLNTIDDNSLFSLDIILQEIDKIYNDNFIKKSFQELVISYIDKMGEKEKYFNNYHPSELSHELWAEFLSKQIEV
jgi:hypothetical protein